MTRLTLALPLLALTVGAQSQHPALTVQRVVAMEYPWFARGAVLQGRVELLATISREGVVTDVSVVSGLLPLADPAKATVLKWLFGGCDQDHCEVKITFTFALLEGSCSGSENCPTEFQADLPNKVTVRAKSLRAMP